MDTTINMKIYSTSIIFNEIVKSLLYTYGKNRQYEDTLFVLGHCNIQSIEQLEYIKKQSGCSKILIYQFEQLHTTYGNKLFMSENIMNILRYADILWDYDLNNIEYLKSIGINDVVFKPLLYSDILVNAAITNEHCDIDVLFYGVINERREKIISMLLRDGINVKYYQNVHGEPLNELISRSKIVLNIHHYESCFQEQARISYLLNNGKCVVSEKSLINYYGDAIIESDVCNMSSSIKSLLIDNKWKEHSVNVLYKFKNIKMDNIIK